jgi:hypothetical protein
MKKSHDAFLDDTPSQFADIIDKLGSCSRPSGRLAAKSASYCAPTTFGFRGSSTRFSGMDVRRDSLMFLSGTLATSLKNANCRVTKKVRPQRDRGFTLYKLPLGMLVVALVTACSASVGAVAETSIIQFDPSTTLGNNVSDDRILAQMRAGGCSDPSKFPVPINCPIECGLVSSDQYHPGWRRTRGAHGPSFFRPGYGWNTTKSGGHNNNTCVRRA